MKKLLVVFFVVLSFGAMSQQTSTSIFKASYTISDVSQEDMFLSAYDWTSTFFTGNGNTLVSQKHSENKLEGNATLVMGTESVNMDYVISFQANTCTVIFTPVGVPSAAMQQYLNGLLSRFERILNTPLSADRKAELKSYQHTK